MCALSVVESRPCEIDLFVKDEETEGVMRILAVIPARGGSKGIPCKNIRLMNGKPLIAYAIANAKASKYITDVFVTTDSREISDVAISCGARVIDRNEQLSTDLVTLDPVIYHAKQQAEQKCQQSFDFVITMQPTSPLLKVSTLDAAIEYTLKHEYDTVISVINKPHLSWGRRENEGVFPLYKERKNRQELPPQYMETGAFVIARANCVRENTRIGERVSVFEVDEQESIDIDDAHDWILTESLMRRKRILFRVDGYIELGLGHIYNCITLALSMVEHDVLLVTHAKAVTGIKKIEETNLPYRTFRTEDELEEIIAAYRPDIWVNDCLNTTSEYISHLKTLVPRVVTIEDLGSGVQNADAVINALYDEDEPRKHVYSGYKYVCLRDEFQIERPKEFSHEVKNIVIMFGGTDPSNLNRLVYDAVSSGTKTFGSIRFFFITGIGYDNEGNGVVTCPEKNIFVCPNVPRVTKYLKEADLVIMGQGRSIFEAACMGVPAIVLSQNEREATHSFAQMEHGFLNLGLGKEVEASLITNTLEWLINTPTVRENMHNLMLSIPLKSGIERVKRIILGEDNLGYNHSAL